MIDSGNKVQVKEVHLNGAEPSGATPIAICGMALRLPGGLHTPQDLWKFLLAKGDARSRVPETRYNVSAYHSGSKIPGTIITEHGYFLDESIKLGALDAGRFSLSRAEVEAADPQQRQMLEVVRECLDDAGEISFRGRAIGCYMGVYGEDWLEVQNRDPQQTGMNRVDGYGDFMLSNRVSYEMDFHGPSMTIRTACSSAMVGLNEAVLAINRGDCESAIIGGSNLIFTPATTSFMTEKGVLSPDGSCKTFSADADGYARAEGINAIFVKPLDAAIRDKNPIRAVIRSIVSNSDGKSQGISHPSTDSQEALIRRAYQVAGIHDFSKTAFVECHGTGTPTGDPVEVQAVANVFGDAGVYIGSVKPNLGHSEGASGLTSLIKCVLALENHTIPPNIKFTAPNPRIPFEERKLTVPTEATVWPQSCLERVSVNSFGVGGSNAHVVLESALSFDISESAKIQSSENKNLLILSANSAKSLQKMTALFEDYIQKQEDNALGNIAYTLACHREYLPHRSFIVAGKNHQIGIVSQGRKVPNKAPSLAMVFTGQGAQWARMGRDLLLQNGSIFQSSVRALDAYLQASPNPPEWTIEKELLKPAASSRVQSAELSQPLCTAVQVALVDAFAAIGVTPDAVVGHSSGEIAAAYAAGAVTAEEAILAAWHRGLAAKSQNKPGAMAAVALSRDQVTEFLNPPNVVIACENSPQSVTLSGDAADIHRAVEKIKEKHPLITARLLKVDKAYHSYHMREVGETYSSVVSKSLKGNVPVKPFFSSVTGKQEKNIHLDAQYWRQNLENPVLFSTAVSALLDSFEDVAFLEVGPHPALSGPIRQILNSRTPAVARPHVGTLERGENSLQSLHVAIGKLFELGVPIDFRKLFPNGSALPDLPRYPWDHDADYWQESRIAKAWRFREHAMHPLLGMRQLESSELEPSWRKILNVNDSPWLRDHKIEEDIILPCAGYIAIAGETMRQLNLSQQRGFQLRKVIVKSAMVLKENVATEIVTTLHPHRLTDSQDSKWWDFTIASYNGHIWTKHCAGQVAPVTEEDDIQELDTVSKTTSLPRKLEAKKYYDFLMRAGLRFNPLFQRLREIQTGTLERKAKAKIFSRSIDDERAYYLHPTVIDACIQSGPLAALLGNVDAQTYRTVPTKIDHIVIRSAPEKLDSDMEVSASADYNQSTGEILGQVQQVTTGGHVLMHMEGLKLSPLQAAAEDAVDSSFDTTARLTWGPHIDFLDVGTLIKPSFPRHLYTPKLDEIARLCMVYSHRKLGESITSLPHLKIYRGWIMKQVENMGATQEWSSITRASLTEIELLHRIDDHVSSLIDTPVYDCAIALQRIAKNILNIYSGDTEPMEILLADDVLYKLYVVTDACDRSDFMQHLAHTKPNLRVLEIGAGTGATTASILKMLSLESSGGKFRYSKYTYTDISSGFFVAAKDRFKQYPNIEYRVLDISKAPIDQGFNDEKYDLILATNVIHATKSLHESLSNIHQLLDKDGRLLLHELSSLSKWPNFIFGTLAGWWYGAADGRVDEPYVSPERWNSELKQAGFNGLDALVLDGQEPHHLNAIMVAKPKALDLPRSDNKVVNLLYPTKTEEQISSVLKAYLESRGYSVGVFFLGDDLPKSQDIISLLDWNTPFFENITESAFKLFQNLVSNLDKSGMLWLTHISQAESHDPRWSQVIGAARSIRTEALIDFATCEIDKLESSVSSIVKVYEAFHDRVSTGIFTPDYEYTIVNDTVMVGRIYPFSLKQELLSEKTHEDSVGLVVSMPGRLSTMNWTIRKARPLVDDEVEVEIHATGLNFKDVLGALAIVPIPERGLGIEASGIVRHVGPAVKELAIGDRVMLLGDGSFATSNITPERLCTKIPDGLDFEDAATMPAVYATAVYSMFNIGKLQAGQSILIHSACGGVGLAAVQLARMAGATIYATVGSDEKVKYLMDIFGIPRHHIFSSRNASFVQGVLRETHGQGVDLALNSLSGELLHATWRCIAEFGAMVDIGKRDMLGSAKLDMDVFLGSRSYTCFYLDHLMYKRASLCKQLLQDIVKYYQKGHITPIKPKTVFEASAIEDVFRQMQHGQHIGKLVISMRSTDGQVKISTTPVKAQQEIRLDSSASYLLVGGLGGLGMAVARRLVEIGARSLVFLGRSATLSSKNNKIFVEELESMGCSVILIQGSVSAYEDVTRSIQASKNLKGILQCSMVLRDQAFEKMSFEDWNTVVDPKVQGTWNLHNATIAAGVNLDFFVLFSSLSCILGQAGQANYAGSNTFLDSFVQYRSNMGLAASSIDIGAVEDVGYVSRDEALVKRMKSTTANCVSEYDLLNAITAATISFSANPKNPRTESCTGHSNPSYTDTNTMILGLSTTIPLSDPESRAFWRRDPRLAIYHNSTSTKSSLDDKSDKDNLKALLAKARDTPEILQQSETTTILAREIGKQLFDFLLRSEEDIDTSVPLSQLGMDSLVGVEMRSWWRQEFKFDITVLEMMGLGSLDALGKRAADGVFERLQETDK